MSMITNTTTITTATTIKRIPSRYEYKYQTGRMAIISVKGELTVGKTDNINVIEYKVVYNIHCIYIYCTDVIPMLSQN